MECRRLAGPGEGRLIVGLIGRDPNTTPFIDPFRHEFLPQ